MTKVRSGPGCGGSCGAGAPSADAWMSVRARERLRQAPVPEAFYQPASLRLHGLTLSPSTQRWAEVDDGVPRVIDAGDGPEFEAPEDFDEIDIGSDMEAGDFDDSRLNAADEEIGEAEEDGDDDADDFELADESDTEAPRILRPTYMTDWRLEEGGEPSRNPRLTRFMGGSLSGLVTNSYFPQHSLPPALFYTRPSGPLSEPPEQLDPVVVPGHGTVRRGKTDVPLTSGGNRPYIWLWFEPLPAAGCTYRWYQFVQVSFFYRGNLSFPNFDPLMEAATGRPVKFRRNTRTPRWDADFHKKDHADKKTRGPGFHPPGLKIPKHDPGRPFRETEIPGTKASVGGTTRYKGILDAPSFCNDNPPPILRCVLRVLKRSFKQQERNPRQKPAPRTRSARVVIDVRSYLTCIRGGKVICIGYVPWTYTQSATVRFTWHDVGGSGGTTRIYELSAELLTCVSTLAIGDWVSPC